MSLGDVTGWLSGGYTVKARIAPAYLVLVPAGVAGAVWFPEASVGEVLTSVLVAPGAIAVLLAQLGRDMGYRKQPALWESWGGPPTTQFLRHRNTEFNSVQRRQCHEKLRQLRPTLALPTPEGEADDPDAADEVYEACIRFLIGETRDRDRFPLVFKENVNYGFRRNLWGMKSLGATIALLGAGLTGVRVWWEWVEMGSATLPPTLGFAVNLSLSAIWVCWVTPEWVRIGAVAYAERLLEACERL